MDISKNNYYLSIQLKKRIIIKQIINGFEKIESDLQM